jgi:predicted metalloprotease with PDZ domain
MHLRSFRGALIAASAALVALAPTAAIAQQRQVEYSISYPNAVHHEAQVTAVFRGVPAGRPLEVRMSRSSPGRYALHEFAKNVYDVKAVDGRNRPLAVTRPNPHQWDVAGHDGTVRVTYTLYADRTDGTYTAFDATHAHMNIPATFMWARGMADAPIRVTFARPAGWRVATQLVATADSATFTAPNLQYFMDSPTEVSAHAMRTWEVARPGGGRQTIRLVVHHTGTEAQVDTFAEMAKKVVAEQIAMWGEAPRFDFGTYTFLADYLPWASGDGMEHRNSTILTNPRPLAGGGARGNLGTLSHEFFHAWNVERLRPRALEPFDFERENMSGELWFAEGFTSYYDDLFIRRAGIDTDQEYAEGLSGTVSAVITAPGRRFFSPVEMSMQAPFVDAASSIDPQNRQNTYLSYYTWGAGVGLGLDLTLRTRFPGKTLDDYMRALWREFGREQTPALAPAKPYTLADLRRVLGEVTGDRAFADDFFRRYIEGRDVVEYERLLGAAGFLLRKSAPGQPWLGAPLQETEGSVLVAGGPVVGSSLYEAGIDRLDRIVSVEGVATAPDSLMAVVRRHRVGETVRMEVEGRGGRRTVPVVLRENPAVEVVTYESAGRPVTDAMRAFRRAWLGSRVEERAER